MEKCPSFCCVDCLASFLTGMIQARLSCLSCVFYSRYTCKDCLEYKMRTCTKIFDSLDRGIDQNDF